VDPATGTVSVASGGFTSGLIPLRYLKTSAGVLVSNEDRRTWAVQAVSGGGGGSVSGTAQLLWDLHLGYASAASGNAGFRVVRGSDPTVELRWNETLDQFEFTNDGSSYVALGSLQGLNLGAGRQTRLVYVASAPVVLYEPARGPGSAGVYSTLNLSAYVSTTTTAVLLRGYMTDSHPGSTLSMGSVAGVTFFRDSATITGPEGGKLVAVAASALRYESLLVPVSNQACVFQVEAASEFSATLRFALTHYLDTVVGPGTQFVSGTQTGLTVSAGVGSHTILAAPFGAAAVRSLVQYLETSGTMTGGTYDCEFYGFLSAAQSQLTSALLFQATGIAPGSAYVTRLPWGHREESSNSRMLLRLSNNSSSAGSFSLVVKAEQYAGLALAWLLPVMSWLWL
jgi:hypothetical protein